MKLFDWIARALGRKLATYLLQPLKHYEQFSVIEEPDLKATLRPGDILLIEGDAQISTAIKYLTQSTWSHVCVFVGPVLQDEKRYSSKQI